MQIAQTILEQLGGDRFSLMTGAKHFVGSADALTFRLPSNFARSGINAVRVKLDPSDTYTVEFMKIRGVKVETVATEEMVYCDTLQATFKRVTGLDTRI